MRALASPEYLDLLRQKHTDDPNWATGGRGKSMRWGHIVKLARKFKCQTILDYGCGKGFIKERLSEEAPDLTVYEYDPGVPEKAGEPPTADIVYCAHVMEHVEPHYVRPTLRRIASLAPIAYFVIPGKRAAETLADGRNAHLTIQPPGWWRTQLEAVYRQVVRTKRVDHPTTGCWVCSEPKDLSMPST